MAYLKLNVESEEELTAYIQINTKSYDAKCESHEEQGKEPPIRKSEESVDLYGLINSVSIGRLSLGQIMMNLDFDESGELIGIEIIQ